MGRSDTLIMRPITQGWEFVNLFYDRRAATFYCRVRKVDPTKNQNDWAEVSCSGATMQIAFDRALETALTERPA